MQKSEWYALYVRPRFERVAAVHLQSLNIEHYLPLRRITRQFGSGTRSIELPLLPGYVFCKAHARMRCSLLTIPGVLHIVGEAIPDQRISELKSIIQPGVNVQRWRFTPSGKTITIQDGALKGITGILDRSVCDAHVFVMSIEAIGRSIGVHIDGEYTFSCDTDSAA